MTKIDNAERFRAAKASLAEFELRRRQGEFITRERVVKMLVERATAFRKSLRAVGRRLAPRLVGVTDPAEIQAVITEALDAILWQAYGRAPTEITGSASNNSTTTPRGSDADELVRVRLGPHR